MEATNNVGKENGQNAKAKGFVNDRRGLGCFVYTAPEANIGSLSTPQEWISRVSRLRLGAKQVNPNPGVAVTMSAKETPRRFTSLGKIRRGLPPCAIPLAAPSSTDFIRPKAPTPDHHVSPPPSSASLSLESPRGKPSIDLAMAARVLLQRVCPPLISIISIALQK